jgi:hypothetical protein
MISREEALVKFQEIIGTKPEFAQILKSQFVDHLSVFQSWALRQSLFAVERSFQEFFLSTALNRASILAGAEDREYVPRMPTPATGKIQIENKGVSEVYIPANQSFQANSGRYYTLSSGVSIPAGDTAVDLSVTQKHQEIQMQTVTEEIAFMELLFDVNKTRQISNIHVYVDVGDGNGLEQWIYTRRFMNSNNTSKIFDIFYSYLDQIGIRFGNGIFGVIPPAGATIEIHLSVTEGNTTLLSGQRLQPVGTLIDDDGSPADVVITVTDTIANGVGPEETESIRRNAHYAPIYNDSLVWAEDFKFFIQRHFPTILWLSVWGEQEMEAEAGYLDLDFVNKIFVSAYRTESDFVWRGAWTFGEDYVVDDVVTYGYVPVKWKCLSVHTSEIENPPSNENEAWERFSYPLETEIPAKLGELRLLNKTIQWVDPVYSTFSLTITGALNPVFNIGEIQAEIRDLLQSNYGKDSLTRKHAAHMKDFYDLINDTGHFRDERAWFNIVGFGTFGETLLSEMVYIDMDATTVNLDAF